MAVKQHLNRSAWSSTPVCLCCCQTHFRDVVTYTQNIHLLNLIWSEVLIMKGHWILSNVFLHHWRWSCGLSIILLAWYVIQFHLWPIATFLWWIPLHHDEEYSWFSVGFNLLIFWSYFYLCSVLMECLGLWGTWACSCPFLVSGWFWPFKMILKEFFPPLLFGII